MTKILQFIDVCKYFYQANQQVVALNNINLSIHQQEFTMLIGPSGSGKTTLLQIAGLLDNISSGELIIDNINCSAANDQQLTNLRKHKIGFVYQYVMLPLLIQDIPKEIAYQKAKEMLELVDLSNRISHKPAQLSGGQQQRVAIARAIVGKPKLVLADEPTGNLDNSLSEKIFSLLKDLTKTYEIACLVVTHNQEFTKMADKIFCIKNSSLITI
ncbi:MAG: ABC transporter ATP-binding protein [Proteobacteria bacterium]|nr:ABC transporter ATP-binding protein [Pseudomonadota bacterium]